MIALKATLLVDELKSLHELFDGAVNKRVSVEHGETLVRYGLAKTQEGGLVITPTGYAKLALEVTRASWIRKPELDREKT